MDSKSKYIDTQKVDHKIQNKKRGEILYYSIDQVADLLNENINNIKYYTSIFDDLLKIQIVDKELRYTDNDIDNLEFLIKLKNKDMSLKEIQDYYSKLPLGDNEVQHPGSNLLSVEELIDSIKEEQRIQFDKFKIQLNDDIQKTNLLYIENITSSIIEAQNKSLDKFKQDLFDKIIEYLNSKFDGINEINLDLYKQFRDNVTEFISKKIDSKNDELKLELKNDFDVFFQSSLTNNEHLIREIKSFKKVIEDAYYTERQVEMDDANTGFLNKLFQVFKSR
ncbi:helix-turn-helix domain-containing protein [Clostridium luticellarii]|uniref:HTH merR-type domain-containing protein n=1 Tax=Clostridium luticellarii TaxID=1691940 RepID=A0A2T0B7D1_9CLOT|nr:helix-turn-helix domain-containing protein [Clostridium luticellarii]PRR79800.1 hypothetical protein CLLU_34270 [Clostridium luticellarii]